MATTNNAIFNYETETDIYDDYEHTYPFQAFKPKMGPLMKNERNDSIKYFPKIKGKRNHGVFWNVGGGYELKFKKPQMYRREIGTKRSDGSDRIHNSKHYQIWHHNINYRTQPVNNDMRLTDSGDLSGYSSLVNNPFHFRFMYKEVKDMLKLKWKDIKERNDTENLIIQQKYLEIINWAQSKVEEFNQTSPLSIIKEKVGILKQNPSWYREDWGFKTFNGASFGNGKNNYLRVWCEEFVREFAHLDNLMKHVIYHYEKTMRMRTALAKISAWFLRMKYNPKSPYCQKWLWEDFEDICEDEDDRRHNPFYEKDINLRKEMETKYECPICLETEHAEKAKTLKCGHKFCRDCINKCLKINKKCPYCRAPQ